MKRIVFTGDIMSSSIQNDAVFKKHNAYLYDSLFCHVADLFSDTFVCGNLETPVCSAEFTNGFASFNTPKEFLLSLKKSGFNLLTTANNHAMDRGKEGLIETVENIEHVGILHTGTYRTVADSDKILVQNFEGCKVSFLSFTYGTNSEVHSNILSTEDTVLIDLLKRQALPQEQIKESSIKVQIKKILPRSFYGMYLKFRGVSDEYTGQLDNVANGEIYNAENTKYLERCIEKIQKAKQCSDIVVVCCHIGGQYNDSIGKYTEHITNKLIESGADCIVGNHPHCILNYKQIDGKYIFYSLGNFSYTPNYGYFVANANSDCSIILSLHISPEKNTIKGISYSVAFVRTDADNISRTYLLYDLIQNAVDDEEKERLIQKHNDAILRFTHKLPLAIQKEYILH